MWKLWHVLFMFLFFFVFVTCVPQPQFQQTACLSPQLLIHHNHGRSLSQGTLEAHSDDLNKCVF